VERESDHVVAAFRQLPEQGIGRRARRAALGGEQLQDDLRTAGPGRERKRHEDRGEK